MEKQPDPEVSALQELCDRHGGFRVVASAIHVNHQSLYQILSRTKLPSGRPKGIGPKLREKLTQRYPGWNSSNPDLAEMFPTKASDMAIRLAAAFDRIPRNDAVRQARAFSAAFAAIEKEL